MEGCSALEGSSSQCLELGAQSSEHPVDANAANGTSEPSDFVNGEVENKVLNQSNTNNELLNSSFNGLLASKENIVTTNISSANKNIAQTPKVGTSTPTRTYSLRPRPKRANNTKDPKGDDDMKDLLPFDMDKLLHRDYKPVTSEEVYLKKLIQQLDSTYSTAVVVVTPLERMHPSLWRKYMRRRRWQTLRHTPI